MWPCFSLYWRNTEVARYYRKSPRKWRRCNLVSGDRLCCQRHGLAMNWVIRPRTSADKRMLSRSRAVMIVWWAIAGLVVPHWPFGFPWTVTLAILGLEVLHARLLGLCYTAAFPLIFLQLRKGPFLRTVLGYVGKRGWGVEGYWCLRKWVQWIPSIGGAKCGLIASNERDVQGFLRLHQRVRCRAVVPDVLACVHMYILYACVYICVCVYVCGHDICIYMHVCMYMYMYAFIHECMCMCMHICA